MKWIRFTINTHIDAVDILSYELDSIGVEGIEIEDSLPLSDEDKKKMFVDIPPDPVEVSNVARVSFYIDEAQCDVDDVLSQVEAILADVGSYTEIGEGTVSVSATEDKDWINNWKEYFKPFRASERIAITPTWIDEVLEEAPIILKIDPGIAFGTGSHETTKLCIQALDKYLRDGDRVLDIGCGSGILGIAALLLGAGHVVATDIDEIAIKVAEENFEVNNISSYKYELLAGNLLADDGFMDMLASKAESRVADDGYDLVTANILPDVIVPLTSIVPRLVKTGGLYITSGILATRAAEVREAFEKNGFIDIVETPLGEWVSLVGTYSK